MSTDIVVTAPHIAGTAIDRVPPILVLDQNAIASMGATSMKGLLERLKPATTSSSGSEPVYLLNGRRVSGTGDVASLPPEAIERIEVLPEQEAARFGFPASVRVSNLITKKRFRAVTLQDLPGTTTEGGGETNYAEVNAARIDGPRRVSLSVSHLRLNPILQSQRAIAADADSLYSVGGTVTGIDGASIDPALDLLAGHRVTAAAVPADATLRRMLASYADGVDRAGDDGGRYRSLQQRSDTIRVDGTLASPIGKALDGSINLSMEAQRGSGANGLAPAVLTVPAGNGAFPFAGDVLLYRYLPGAVLRQRNTSMALHAGATVQGGIRRWSWNLTASYDRVNAMARSEQGVPIDGLQASIDGGGDPLGPLDPVAAAVRGVQQSDTVTGTLVTKAVANGAVLRLPAGDAQVAVALDYARSTSADRASIVGVAAPGLTRTIRGGSVNADLPITSTELDILPFLGRLTVNARMGVSDVSDVGSLVNLGYGLNWSPVGALQVRVSVDDARTPPAIALLTNPILTRPNTPFFDFTTGTSGQVTSIMGGNPTLTPERRRVTTLGASIQPIKGEELRLDVDLVSARIDNQTTALGGATPAFQSAFPEAFGRDALGRLVTVDLRPVNVAREQERSVRTSISFSTALGRKPPPDPPPAGVAPSTITPPARAPKPRPTENLFVSTTWRLDDRLALRPGQASLDLLDGATLTGTGGRPRWETEIDVRGTAGPASFGLYGRLQGPTRVRSDLAASDLHFSARIWLVPYASVNVGPIVKRPWAQAMTLNLAIENLLNDRIDVRDRNGATPDRFQPAYIDPYGRSIRLGVRKAL